MRRSPSRATFRAAGFRGRETFDHEVLWLPKAYPDSYLQLARRGASPSAIASARFWQINLYATAIGDLPAELFTDPQINWHGQGHGRPGLVGAAGLCIVEGRLIVSILQSDLMQQGFRSPLLERHACRAKLDDRFGRWWLPLLNAALDFAIANGFDSLYVPTSDQIVALTKKRIQPTLFARVYDAVAARYECQRVTTEMGEYWQVPVATNLTRIVPLDEVASPPIVPIGEVGHPAILLYHDIEEDVDTDVSPEECRRALDAMLAAERRAGVHATYNVLGTLFAERPETVDAIASDGHALGFHSFDHTIGDVDQLARCRTVDPKVRGYRPARSLITNELTPANLAAANMDWILNSTFMLGYTEPGLDAGVVYLPIHLDDYRLWTGDLTRDQWLARLRGYLAGRAYVAVGLHDCYAARWLDWYDDLLGELSAAGRFVTADELAGEMFLAAAA